MITIDNPTVVYTHSDYEDVLNIFLANGYIQFKDLVFFSDKKVRSFDCYIYNENDSYSERVLKCLSQYSIERNNQPFLYLHEDFIPYGEANSLSINDYYKSVLYKNYDYIRLIRSGEATDIEPIYSSMNDLYPSTNLFAIQATIFNPRFFLRHLLNNRNCSIWELEARRNTIKNHNGVFVYKFDSKKRGLAHYDSEVFPYMATAIVKGKWNKEYEKEIRAVVSEEIINKRGWTS